jgi:fused signal recognition particle receptor
MFDGLKDKLGRFSDDVEEDVDEDAIDDAEAEAADEGATPAEDEGVEDRPEVTDEQPETVADDPSEAVEETTAESDGTVTDADGTPESDSDVPPAPEGDGVADEDGESVPDATDETADDATEDDDSGGSLLSRLTGRSDDESADEDDDAAEASEGPETAVAEAEAESAEAAAAEDESADGSAAEESDDGATEESDEDGRGLTEKAKLFATGKTVIDEDDLQGHLDDLELALLQSDVEMAVAQEILDGVEANLTGQTRRRLESTGNLVEDALREALYDVISVGQFDFDQRVAEAEKPFVVIFTGVNGVGKTTTIAKLSRYFEQRGLSSVLANGDTYRAGANEQLEQHADNLDRKVIAHEQGSDPAAVIYDAVEYAEANDVDVVLGDTAGRLHTNDGLMDQLEKIDRVIDPDMTLFVDESVAGQDAVNRAREFDDAAEVDGTILTKADADPQGGAAISIAHVTGKPILFLGTGQEYDDLERFDPEAIVDRLFEE